MRKAYLMIIFITLLSCSQKKANEETVEKINKTGVFYPEVESRSVIIGQIENMQEFSNESKTIRLFVDDISINEQILYLTETDDNGRFLFNIPLSNSINIHLEYCDGNINPYVFPNDTLIMNCKISKVGSLIDINATSYDEKHKKFQNEFQKYNSWMSNEIVKFDKSFSTEKPYEEQKEICLNFERSIHENINTKIKNGLSNQIIVNYLRNSATYYSYYRIFRVGKAIENPEDKTLFFSFMTDSAIFNKEALVTSWYRFFLNYYSTYVEPNVTTKVISSGKSEEQVKKEQVAQRIKKLMNNRSGIWQDFLIASNINSSVIKSEAEISATSIDYYISLVQEQIKDIYTQQLLISMLNQERLSILERDNLEFPDSEITNKVSQPVDSLFNNILLKNKGKVIYLDFWGTWCSGCFAQFPYVEKMHNNFNEKDVAFVYLCCSSQQAPYENVIKKFQLKGQHYLLNQEQYEYFEKQFQIAGLPRYVLIDKYGKVYDKNASRPADEQTLKVINKLINQ